MLGIGGESEAIGSGILVAAKSSVSILEKPS